LQEWTQKNNASINKYIKMQNFVPNKVFERFSWFERFSLLFTSDDLRIE